MAVREMRRRAAIVAALVAATLVALALAPSARATPSPTLLVTYAARVCPTYTDITANRARNDIQESLRDLGADTPYQGGEPIDPTVEARVQPNCQPLPGWRFTLGRGYKTRAVSGPWGSLSIVTSPFSTSIETQASTPLLNTVGQDTGNSIAGAVTVALDPTQASLAARPNSLWVQGGTTTDPILNVPYPGQYGFGALRCAIDNLNGDNVEWTSFPSGVTHVFCFAYYVRPPPTSGTITVRKEVSGGGSEGESFPFDGNLSFNSDGRFSLQAADGRPAEQSFIRAETRPGDGPWTVRELVPDGWKLSGLSCTSRTGASQTHTDATTGRADIALHAGDVVLCTYADRFAPPPARLLVRKLTLGGVGAFGFRLTGGSGGTRRSTATTTQEGVGAVARPGFGALEPGDYRLAESSPSSDAGRWVLSGISCNGERLTRANPLDITLHSDTGVVCSYRNRFIPRGSLVIHKVTLGGTATTGFLVAPTGRDPREYRQTATTTAAGVPARAKGDPTTALRLGRYAIDETTPESPGGSWSLVAVECDGVPTPFAAGRVRVTLSPRNPAADCTFYDRFTPGPTPPTPPNPPPAPPAPGPDVEPHSDLRVVKRVDRPAIVLGATATYRITVTNRGPDPADGVQVGEQLFRGQVPIVSLRSSKGTCRNTPVPVCSLGTLARDQTATVTAVVRPTRVGVFSNRAAAGTASFDPNPRAAQSGAILHVRRPSRPAFTG